MGGFVDSGYDSGGAGADTTGDVIAAMYMNESSFVPIGKPTFGIGSIGVLLLILSLVVLFLPFYLMYVEYNSGSVLGISLPTFEIMFLVAVILSFIVQNVGTYISKVYEDKHIGAFRLCA